MIAAIVLAAAVSAQACSRSRERPDRAPAEAAVGAEASAAVARDDAARAEPEPGDDAVRADAARADAARAEPADKPVAMKASPKASPAAGTGAKAVKAVVSASLAGSDRRLVERPFDAAPAGDFELGELYGPGSGEPADAARDEAMLELERGLLSGEPPYGSMGPEAAALARARFGDAFPLRFARVRFATPVVGPGPVASVRFRAFADDSGSRAIVGLAIIAPGDDGEWIIEHLELDPDAIEGASPRSEPWDPYGAIFKIGE